MSGLKAYLREGNFLEVPRLSENDIKQCIPIASLPQRIWNIFTNAFIFDILLGSKINDY